ncbi:uncharacterized protein L201_007566 [Kwoniella dendrophila CBS 6074]|uniref:2'-5' RNA ligase n=1 Tax=Kwoniella dendrophila CBS 6074 TaxID=1295534 RepID=A0AAX4K6W5_9TREE
MSPPRQLTSPLILTLRLDKTTHKLLTDLRYKHFPKHRNFLEAHVTLFHAIPLHRYDELDYKLNEICNNTNQWDVYFGEPEKMGNRGVYLVMREKPSFQTSNLHKHLLSELKRNIKRDEDKLTNQDLQTMKKPHVTILNKAENENQVNDCLDDLNQFFDNLKNSSSDNQRGQHRGKAVGFEVFEYLGGPWKSVKEYSFKGDTA